MKALILFAICCGSLFKGYAQEDKAWRYEVLRGAFANQVQDYHCIKTKAHPAKTVSDAAFRKQIRAIFSTVILNSLDLADKGSAVAVAEDKTAQTASVNFNTFLAKRRNLMLTSGLSLTNKSGSYSAFGSDGWAKGMGLSLGLIVPLHSGQFFDSDTCEALSYKRQRFVEKKLLAYRQLLNFSVLELETQETELRHKTEEALTYTSVDTADYGKKREKTHDRLSALRKLLAMNEQKLRETAQSDIDGFDQAAQLFSGYSLRWLNFTGRLVSKSYTIGNEAIVQKPDKIDGVYSYSVEGSFNWQHVGKRSIWFLQGYTRFAQSSFLDDPTLHAEKLNLVGFPEPASSAHHYIVNEDAEILGQYSQIRTPVRTFETGGYGAAFCIAEKKIGFFARAALSAPSCAVHAPYHRSGTSLIGAIFRTPGEKGLDTATFSLGAGFEHAPFDLAAHKSFVVKASVAVPFNIFVNPSKEKKS